MSFLALSTRQAQRRPLLAFTALTALGLPVCVLWLDKPLMLAVHRYAAGLLPLFEAGTNAIDRVYDTLLYYQGFHILWWLLGLGYVLGRWALRQRWATVLLLVLLTELSSEFSTNILKGFFHRLRPTFLADGTDSGGTFGSVAGAWDSFPSGHTAIYWGVFWPLVLAFPRWRGSVLAVPVFIALGRLVLAAHYLSDVWAAIWLVVAWAALWQALAQGLDNKLSGPRA